MIEYFVIGFVGGAVCFALGWLTGTRTIMRYYHKRFMDEYMTCKEIPNKLRFSKIFGILSGRQ